MDDGTVHFPSRRSHHAIPTGRSGTRQAPAATVEYGLHNAGRLAGAQGPGILTMPFEGREPASEAPDRKVRIQTGPAGNMRGGARTCRRGRTETGAGVVVGPSGRAPLP